MYRVPPMIRASLMRGGMRGFEVFLYGIEGGEMMSDSNQKRDLKLLERIRANDQSAKEELIRKYIPMVKYLVRNSYAGHNDFEDLMQEGLIGLLGAIEEYNGSKHNVKFSSFAYLCIIRKIYNCIRQAGNNKNRALSNAISLYTYIDSEESKTILDLISNGGFEPEELVEREWIKEKVYMVLRNYLSNLEFTVIWMMLKGYTASEIEKEIGVSTKSIDNARTRARFKIERIVNRYGSILSPKVPHQVRKRKDLYIPVNITI